MNLKKIKIILYFPLALFFIANIFYSPLPTEAADVCTWWLPPTGVLGNCAANSPGLGTNADLSKRTDQKPSTCNSGFCLCCCKPETPAASGGLNASMPNFKIPDINLQVAIPGLNLTKGNAIKCTEQGGKKTCNFPWIGEYIAGIYKYAIGIIGILAAVVLMIGGVIWIVDGGSATMIGEAKAWIGASLTGLIIALTSYVILYQVNPALVGFKGLNITLVDQIPIPEDVKEFAAKCKPTGNGACATSNMIIFGSKAMEASAICMAESSGNPNAFNKSTKCSNGDYYAVWGLFQFNLSANKFFDGSTTLDCPSAFGGKTWVNSSPNCSVTDPALYQQCVAAASNPDLSRINAQKLVTTNSWGPWEANSKWCKF